MERKTKIENDFGPSRETPSGLDKEKCSNTSKRNLALVLITSLPQVHMTITY